MPWRAMWLLLIAAVASPAAASDALQWSGFALLRGSSASSSEVPLRSHDVSAQVQVGIDWRPSVTFGSHIHLLARNDANGSARGRVGVVEAFLEQSFVRGDSRLHLTEGAFFLPTSRENVDELWASPYTISSSALNTWWGEELRPIGVDAAYTWRRQWTGGVTVFRGNDTLGGLPADRGWTIGDRWSLLGEHVRVDPEYDTSISAETDHRLGWCARGRWTNEHATLQLTHLDNRSDAIQHDRLLNWETRFDLLSADYSAGDWTIAAETGWGVTSVIFFGTSYPTDLRASYALVSRRLGKARATLRAESFQSAGVHRHAITAAYFFYPRHDLRAGIEAIASGGEHRVAIELRYAFH